MALLAFGLLVSIGVVIWSLLRGRRAKVVRFRVDPRSPFGNGSPFAGMRRGPATAPQEVVDIEARVVPDAKPSLPNP